ncbi:MAG: hypothetical protein ACP5LB_05200 [Candidatus Bathyarchaeia archaeon]
MSSSLLRNYTMYDLVPLIKTWLEGHDFIVSVLANRIDGTKKTGFFTAENVTIFLEDYPEYCIVKCQSPTDICNQLTQYLQSLPQKERKEEKEVIIKEREVVVIPCPYCGTLVKITEQRCPHCGAYIKG